MIPTNARRDPITLNEVKRVAPSVFSKEASPKTSKTYGFINTETMVKALMDAKFVPVEARQNRSKDTAFTRHMVVFRRAGELRRVQKVGDAVPQITLMNAHNTQSAFHIYAGAYRMVCSNGLIISAGELGHAKVRHSIEGAEHAVQIALDLIENADGAFGQIDLMQKTKVDERAALRYARESLAVAYPYSATMIEPAALLVPRRKEDNTATVWNLFNTVQENVMRGGLEGKSATGRVTRTRGIGRIYREIETNRGLWSGAVKLLEKVAA